jgi:hypothetical protein
MIHDVLFKNGRCATFIMDTKKGKAKWGREERNLKSAEASDVGTTPRLLHVTIA